MIDAHVICTRRSIDSDLKVKFFLSLYLSLEINTFLNQNNTNAKLPKIMSYLMTALHRNLYDNICETKVLRNNVLKKKCNIVKFKKISRGMRDAEFPICNMWKMLLTAH